MIIETTSTNEDAGIYFNGCNTLRHIPDGVTAKVVFPIVGRDGTLGITIAPTDPLKATPILAFLNSTFNLRDFGGVNNQTINVYFRL